MSNLSLRMATDQQSVEAVFNPQADDTKLTEASVRQLLADSEFKIYKPSDSGIKALLAAANQAKSDSAAQTISVHQIAKRVDAEFSLKISPDQMSATLEVVAAFGGAPVERASVDQLMSDEGVIKGVDEEALEALLEKARHSDPGASLKDKIAKAQPAVNGKDGCWVLDVETMSQQLRPQVREDGTVDMLDFGEIVTVKNGEPLMHRQPPTAGKSGYTVTGSVLEAKPGSDALFIEAEGVALAKRGQLIVATRDGMPVEIPGGIRVDDIYNVKQVDISTGHVVFDGSVVVRGDVEEGMKISATGDVSIGGSVFSAEVEAEGDITIRKGVVGFQRQDDKQHFNSEDLSCSVKAGGRLQIGFAQYARIEAGFGIKVDKQLLHCLTQTHGEVDIGKGTDRNSKLIGGLVKAEEGVRCGEFGSEAFVPTEVQITPDLSDVVEQIQVIEEQLQAKEQLIDDLKKVLPKISALPKGAARTERLTKLVNTINHTGHQLVKLKQRREQLDQERQQRMGEAQLISMGPIYPNVSVKIAHYSLKTRREHQGGGICFRGGELVYDASLRWQREEEK